MDGGGDGGGAGGYCEVIDAVAVTPRKYPEKVN
jgi:hypothetical protein